MKNVLLIFDNQEELNFIENNLKENGFQVFKADGLNDGLKQAQEIIPDLIVINTLDDPKEIEKFQGALKKTELKDVLLLCLIELENYLFSYLKKHFVIKPVRPKLLLSLIRGIMNNEEINWLLAVH